MTRPVSNMQLRDMMISEIRDGLLVHKNCREVAFQEAVICLLFEVIFSNLQAMGIHHMYINE